MKKYFWTALLFSVSILSCDNEKASSALTGAWTVVSFENLAAGTSELPTQENTWGKEIRIRFNEDQSPKTFSGTNVTNEITGEFTILNNAQFTVSNLNSTNVNQPRWADEFLSALLDPALTYKIIGNSLIIDYANGSKRVTLKRVS